MKSFLLKTTGFVIPIIDWMMTLGLFTSNTHLLMSGMTMNLQMTPTLMGHKIILLAVKDRGQKENLTPLKPIMNGFQYGLPFLGIYKFIER